MDITDAIEALPGEQQEEFKQYLNYYKRLI